MNFLLQICFCPFKIKNPVLMRLILQRFDSGTTDFLLTLYHVFTILIRYMFH